MLNRLKLILDFLSEPIKPYLGRYRFTSEKELKNLLDYYKTNYISANPDCNPWRRVDKTHLYKAKIKNNEYFDETDTPIGIKTAGVCFDIITLDETEEAVQNAGTIGRTAVNKLIDSSAYFLAQNVAIADVPDELRIGLAVCHKTHWTTTFVQIRGFKEFYKYLVEEKARLSNVPIIPKVLQAEGVRLEKSPAQYVHSNNERQSTKLPKVNIPFRKYSGNKQRLALKFQKDIILKGILGIPKGKRNDSNLIATHLAQIPNIPLKFSTHHLDSLNQDKFFRRSSLSFQWLQNIFPTGFLKHNHKCSQQSGSTCGEHAITNLLIGGMTDSRPLINNPRSEVTSKTLRNHTNYLNKKNKTVEEKNHQTQSLLNKIFKAITKSRRAPDPQPSTTNPAMLILAKNRQQRNLSIGNSVEDDEPLILNPELSVSVTESPSEKLVAKSFGSPRK